MMESEMIAFLQELKFIIEAEKLDEKKEIMYVINGVQLEACGFRFSPGEYPGGIEYKKIDGKIIADILNHKYSKRDLSLVFFNKNEVDIAKCDLSLLNNFEIFHDILIYSFSSNYKL